MWQRFTLIWAVQDSKTSRAKLAEDKAALTREAAEWKARSLEQDHELRLRQHALEKAEKEGQAKAHEVQELTASSQVEAAQLRAQAVDARSRLEELSRRCLVRSCSSLLSCLCCWILPSSCHASNDCCMHMFEADLGFKFIGITNRITPSLPPRVLGCKCMPKREHETMSTSP